MRKNKSIKTIDSVNWVAETFNLNYKTFAFPHTSEGVKNSVFETLVGGESPKVDLILGNRTGMLENHPRVLHRFIGENPEVPFHEKCNAVLAYSAINKMTGKKFVKRD